MPLVYAKTHRFLGWMKRRRILSRWFIFSSFYFSTFFDQAVVESTGCRPGGGFQFSVGTRFVYFKNNFELLKTHFSSKDKDSKTGPLIIIAVYQPPSPFVESEFDMNSGLCFHLNLFLLNCNNSFFFAVNFSELRLLGYVQVSGKKYYVVPPPLS